MLRKNSNENKWEIGFNLTEFGREGSLKTVESGEIQTDGNQIELKRGSITEWYVNTAGGIEQGFTIDNPPENRMMMNRLF